jgi:glutamyl-tRNA reductase
MESLMRVGVIGINHKLADLKLRDQLAKISQKRFGPTQSLFGSNQCVLLSTCNRTEIYFSCEDLAAMHTSLLRILRDDVEEEFDHKLYSYFGVDCFSHLTRVTSGLDSAIVAETEIQGQVKSAYEMACNYHRLSKELHFLFQKSMGIAKKIRSDLDLGRGMPSLEHAILQMGKEHFKEVGEPRLLFIGASNINQKILGFLKSKEFTQITLCNRSDDYAIELASNFGVHHLEWSKFSHWHYYDWIIFGTKSPEYLITKRSYVSEGMGSKLIMDLSVPRNVDPKMGQDPHITLMNIDHINKYLKNRRHGLHEIVLEAEQRVSLATRQHAFRYQAKENSKLALLSNTA